MCGIAGSININLSPTAQRAVLSSIAHRGPDDSGSFHKDNIWLANTRLAIQDLTGEGHQPMQSADGRYTIVFNGEIYNHWELRKALIAKGCTFHSTSDTETLLQAFITEGTECLQQLNGIYAFAIYDQWQEELLIARDPLGVKPFYYYGDGEQLLFASELKAILQIEGLNYTIRPEAFYNYLLLLYQPEAMTPFKKIHKLLPGHYIRFRKGVVEKPLRFYLVPFDGIYHTSPHKQDWVAAVEASLLHAVQAQLISDAPVGFFLSGGLDSSLIAAMACRENASLSMPCFTIDTGSAFREEGFEDDLAYARKAAGHLKLDLHVIPGSIDIVNEFDSMILSLDEPQADPAAIYVRKIAAAARALGVKVLLSGTGADDVFSGYRRHQALYYEPCLSHLPKAITTPAATLLKWMGRHNAARRLSKVTAFTGGALQQRIARHFWTDPALVSNLFNREIAAHLPDPFAGYQDLLQEIPAEKNKLNQMLYWELCTFLPAHNLNYTDKMSMAAGVETRVPYLDTNLIRLACQLPPALKMKGTETKHILREVARKYLPPEIIYRKKTGFGAPVRQWIKGDMSTMVRERLLSDSLQRWHIFNPTVIQQLIEDNERNRTDGAYTLFSLLAIESWLRQFAAK